MQDVREATRRHWPRKRLNEIVREMQKAPCFALDLPRTESEWVEHEMRHALEPELLRRMARGEDVTEWWPAATRRWLAQRASSPRRRRARTPQQLAMLSYVGGPRRRVHGMPARTRGRRARRTVRVARLTRAGPDDGPPPAGADGDAVSVERWARGPVAPARRHQTHGGCLRGVRGAS